MKPGPFLPPTPKGSPALARKRATGGVAAGHEIEHTDREKNKTLLAGDSRVQVRGGNGDAYVGQSIGFTIPGPKGSYLSARVDAHCYLPCGTDPAEIRAAYQKCKDLISAELETDSRDVAKFFDDWQKNNT